MCSCRNCSSCGQYGEQSFLCRNRRGIHEAQQETFDGICSSGRGRICLPPACVCSGCGLHDGYGQCRRRRRRQVSRDDEHNHGAGDQGARLRDLSDILSQVPGLYMAPAAKDSKMVRVLTRQRSISTAFRHSHSTVLYRMPHLISRPSRRTAS